MKASQLNNRRGAGIVAVLIVVAVVLVAFWFIVGALFRSSPGPATYTVWTGLLTTTQSRVDRPLPFVYNVSTQDITVAAGGGSGATPISKTAAVGQGGIPVRFVLDGIDAVFDDGTRDKTVTTDARGDATFIIKPKFDGQSGLTMTYVNSDGTTVTDTDHPVFEVEAP